MPPTFPQFLYHKTLAPEGKLVKSEADVPVGDGWVDTPAAFEEGYEPPPPQTDARGNPTAAPVPGHVHRAYPSHRYNAAGESRLVKNAEEDAALDLGEWKDTPDPEAFGADAIRALDAPPPGNDGTVTQPPVSTGRAQAQKAELYASKVPDIVDGVARMTDLDKLQMVHGFELSNPRGPRAGVIKAIEKRLSELAPAPE